MSGSRAGNIIGVSSSASLFAIGVEEEEEYRALLGITLQLLLNPLPLCGVAEKDTTAWIDNRHGSIANFIVAKCRYKKLFLTCAARHDIHIVIFCGRYKSAARM